jgi:deoxyribodipyrimidine photolyase
MVAHANNNANKSIRVEIQKTSNTPNLEQKFNRLRDGQTGIPIINASQREKALHGYTSYTIRRIVALFAIHHTHIP